MCQKLPTSAWFWDMYGKFPTAFPIRISHKNFPQEFPARFSRKISHKIFLQDFPQEFPATFSRNIFPREFPQHFPARFSHNIFPQHFPTTFSCKNFPQDCPTRFSHKIFPQHFPARISHKIFPQDFPARISHKIFPSWILIGLLPITLFQMLNFHQSLPCLIGLLIIKGPRCPHHPFPKSYGNPTSMNKLTLKEPAITVRSRNCMSTQINYNSQLYFYSQFLCNLI